MSNDVIARQNAQAEAAREVIAAGDLARVAITGTGPLWHEFCVTADGKVLPCLSLVVEVNPAVGKCQATLVIEDFTLDLYDVPAHVEVKETGHACQG